MRPDRDIIEKGILIVTGSTLRAEHCDRPMAYDLKNVIENQLAIGSGCQVVVISDLWYLNDESLHKLPVISIGGPGVNAVTANLFRQVPTALVVENTLVIQMDTDMQDLRASIWGMNYPLTINALELFIEKGYLERFLEGAMANFL